MRNDLRRLMVVSWNLSREETGLEPLKRRKPEIDWPELVNQRL